MEEEGGDGCFFILLWLGCVSFICDQIICDFSKCNMHVWHIKAF